MLQLTMEQQSNLAKTLLSVLKNANSVLAPKTAYTYQYHENLQFEFWGTYFDDTRLDTITVIGRVHDHDHDGITIPFDWNEEKQLDDLKYIVRMCVLDAD